MLKYPGTRKVDVVDEYHGESVPDPYRWLEDLGSPETSAWVEGQNALTFEYLRGIRSRDRIHARLTELWDWVRDGSRYHPVPLVARGRYVFFRNNGLEDQPALYVQDGPEAEPRLLLDPNDLSDDGTVALSSICVTPDAKLLAYALATGGSDWLTIRVRSVDTGVDLPDEVRWVKFSTPSWTHDGGGFFYSAYPAPEHGEAMREANRGQRLCYHRLGTSQQDDLIVYERPDHPEWGFDAEVSEDGRYVFVRVWHGSAPENRLFYLDLGDPDSPDPTGPMVELMAEADACYLPAGNVGRRLFLVTDLGAPRRRLVAVDLDRPEPADWTEVVPEQGPVLESAQVLGGRLVLHYLQDSRSILRVHDLDGGEPSEIELPALGTVTGIGGTAEGSEAFYAFTSFLHPTTVIRHDLDTGASEAFGPAGLDFDASLFETVQVFYRSADGTEVPMFITGRRDLPRDGARPVMLYGYGGFNVSMTPFFSVPNLVWIERGGLLAIPNLRGGGEYGEDWHRAGTRDRKQNVFDDFIGAAEHLVREGYTRPDRIAIAGGSNGGLLVGACMVQRPDLFGAALPSVGVMDMLRFHRFTIGWAWVSDYGSADNPEEFPYLRAYSPLHNLTDGTCYPATLVTTADHDDRVVPAHSFKFTARLQEAQGCSQPILIRVDVRAGHGDGKPTRMLIDEAADRMAFAWRHLGMDESDPPD